MSDLRKDEAHHIARLWKLRDLDHAGAVKGRDTKAHLHDRRREVHWIETRAGHIYRNAHTPGMGGWARGHRGERFQYLHKTALADVQGRLHHDSMMKLALHSAAPYVGKHEVGSNDAPWLRDIESYLVKNGHALSWMIPGNPYCGMGVIFSYQKAGIHLPDNFVGTMNICPAAGMRFAHEGRHWVLRRVSFDQVKPGGIIVFNFGSGGAKHTGLARGPARNGQMPTREFNTSPGNYGSQSNGGGCYDRYRSTGLMLCALNLVEVK